MRSWAAITAALIVLVAFVLIPFFMAVCSSDNLNEGAAQELKNLSQAVGTITSGLEMPKREEVLSSMKDLDGIDGGLYTPDGQPICLISGESVLPGILESHASGDLGISVFSGDNADGTPMTYAIYQYDDGAFLVFSQERVLPARMFVSDPRTLCSFVVLLIGTVLLLLVCYAAIRREELVSRVMKTLDDFADGNYDARVQPLNGKSDTVAEYNAILARIESRIFSQRSRNQAISTVMNQMQNGIVVVDQNLRVIVITPVAKKLLGVVGNPEGKLFSECSNDVNLDSVFTDAMQQSGIYTNDVAARTTVGRGRRPLRLYVSPMRRDGNVVGALAMVEDISELKRLEQVRTDFAANVSHELKTPLTSIRGFVETLEAGAIDNPEMAHKFLRIIMLETERLTRLINDILSISKLESGDTEVSVERIRLDKMAYDVADMLTIQASEKNVTIHSRMNSKPVYIMGNPDRVEQMLINLIENAVKYNKEGGSVTVQVFANEEEASITISDTGIGIDEDHLPRLFERFYRVDKGRSRAMGGTGLGLAIVKHIVRSMNGEIEVHSKLGEGTEFLITLPIAPPENPDKDTIFDD